MHISEKLINVCVTQHYELVVAAGRCIAVRERDTGAWLEDHHALDERVALIPSARSTTRLAGWSLVVHTFGMRLHVGPVLAVVKPDASTLAHLGAAGRTILQPFSGALYAFSEPG